MTLHILYSKMMVLRLLLNSSNFSFSIFLSLNCLVIVWISDSRSLICLWLREMWVLFWEMSWLSFVISFDSFLNWRSRSCSVLMDSSRSLKPFLSSLALVWTSAILFNRNDSSIGCVQVGQTVLSAKNLCSFVIVDTLFDIWPLKLFSLDSFLSAPTNFSCSVLAVSYTHLTLPTILLV